MLKQRFDIIFLFSFEINKIVNLEANAFNLDMYSAFPSLNLFDLNIEPSCQLCSAFYVRDIDKLFELNLIIG